MKYSVSVIAIALLATANAQSVRNSLPKLPTSNRVCDYQSNGYFFSSLRTYGADSRAYCESIGAELVSVDNSNFADLTQMIVKCLGPEQKAWVNSWDGNTFADSPLAIWTGLQPGSGSININIDNEPLFGICSVRRRGLTRPQPNPIIASAIAHRVDAASSEASDEASTVNFDVPGFALNPSEFPSAENINLNDAFGINSAVQDPTESAVSGDVIGGITGDAVEGIEEDAEEVPSEEEEEEEEEEFVAEEAVEEEEYENIQDDEPVSIENNIESNAPQMFKYSTNNQ